MRTYKRRDLTVIELNESQSLVIACDSCGAVGEKQEDELKCPPAVTGLYTARVPLIEALCSGAQIVSVIDTVCNEMNNTGAEIIRGVRAEMAKLGLEGHILTGSTEENFPTVMTGIGVTVVAVADSRELRFANEGSEGYIILLGTPNKGADVTQDLDYDGIPLYGQIQSLLRDEDVLEIVPAGSKGIGYECEMLSKLTKRPFTPADSGIDLSRSAGPATCIIALVGVEWVRREKAVIIGKIGNPPAI